MPDPGRAIHLDRRPSPLRRARWWLLGAALVAGWFAWAVLDRADASGEAPAPARLAGQAVAAPTAAANANAPFSAEGERARQAQHALWLRRLELAQDTLENYRRATRYPGFVATDGAARRPGLSRPADRGGARPAPGRVRRTATGSRCAPRRNASSSRATRACASRSRRATARGKRCRCGSCAPARANWRRAAARSIRSCR